MKKLERLLAPALPLLPQRLIGHGDSSSPLSAGKGGTTILHRTFGPAQPPQQPTIDCVCASARDQKKCDEQEHRHVEPSDIGKGPEPDLRRRCHRFWPGPEEE